MFPRSWRRKLGRATRRNQGREAVRFKPWLEALETRVVPTVTFTGTLGTLANHSQTSVTWTETHNVHLVITATGDGVQWRMSDFYTSHTPFMPGIRVTTGGSIIIDGYPAVGTSKGGNPPGQYTFYAYATGVGSNGGEPTPPDFTLLVTVKPFGTGGGGGGGGGTSTPQIAFKSQPPNQVVPGQPFDVALSETGPTSLLPTSVTLSLTGDATFTPVTANFVRGVADFPGLSVSTLANGDTFTATANNVDNAISTAFDVVAQITTHTWSGLARNKDGSHDPRWSSADNWLEETAPSAGQTLIFSAASANFNPVDDMPNLVVGGMTFGATYNLTSVKGDTVDLNGTLEVDGGNPDFNAPLFLGVPTAAGAFQPDVANPINLIINTNITLQNDVSGNLQIIKSGVGVLNLENRNNTYTGGTVLQAGSLIVNNNTCLGTGEFDIQAGATPVTLKCTQAVTLANDVGFQSGTLDVQGLLTLAGNVTASGLPGGTIDPADSAKVTITGSLTGSVTNKLTVGGSGPVLLNGPLNSAFIVVGDSGLLDLGKGLSGSGTLDVQGGKLASASTNQFAGIVELEKGTIEVSTDNALGTAVLQLQGDSSSFGILTAEGFTLNNQVNLQTGNLKVSGNLTLGGPLSTYANSSSSLGPLEVTGSLTVDGPITLGGGNLSIEAVSAISTVRLNGAISGMGLITAVGDGTGTVTVAGALNNSATSNLQNSIAVDVQGNVKLANTFTGVGGIQIDSGGELSSSGIGPYTGAIYLDEGTIVADANDAFGSAQLTTQAAYVSTLKYSGGTMLGNALMMNGGTLVVNGDGNAVFNGPVRMAAASTIVSHVMFTLNGQISGPGTLTVGGTGQGSVVLSGTLNSFVTVNGKVFLNDANSINLQHLFSGTGGITVDTGGALNGNFYSSDGVVTYSGTITLNGGTAIAHGTNAFGAQGAGNLVVDSNGGVLDSNNNFSLSNGLNMTGGNLTVAGSATIGGPVTMTVAGQINPNHGSKLALSGDVSGSGMLTVGGAGTVALGGSLSSAVQVNSEVDLEPTFSGTGGITVATKGLLESKGVGDYSGTVTLAGGTVDAHANNAFGTQATLAVQSAGGILQAEGMPTLGNDLTLTGGALRVESTVTLSGTVSASGTSAINPDAGTTVTLGNVTGTGTLNLGGKGNATLSGLLDFVTVGVQGKVTLKSTFGDGNTPGSLTVAGGELISQAVGTFTGQITLNQGTLVPMGNNAFGTGSLMVSPTGPVEISMSGRTFTLANPLQLLGSTLLLSQGSLTFTQPVTLSGSATIQTAGGKLILQGGVGKGNILTLTGSDLLQLGGLLNATEVDVPSPSQFAPLAGLASVNLGVVDAKGKQIFPV